MKNNQGSKFTSSNLGLISTAALTLLLIILAIFQYYWLGQLSDAEKIRMKTNLQTSAERFAEEFDREFTKIYTTFSEINLNAKKNNAELLKQTLANWKNNSDFQKLVSNIYAVNILPTQQIQFYNLDTNEVKLNKVKWPGKLMFLKKYFNQDLENIFFRSITLTHGPILKPVPMVVVIQPSEIILERFTEDCTDNWLVLIVLDEEVLMNQFISALVKKYFYMDNQLKYNLLIHKQGKNSEELYKSNEQLKISDFSEPDASANLGTWRTRNMVIASAQYVSDKSELKISKKLEEEKSLSIKIFTGDSSKEIESSKYLIAKMDRWELLVNHIDGSLESIVKQTRLKNLLISYFILIILGTGIILALIYARRIQKIGQQQLEFVAGVTHELRTPLAVIQSAGENIVDGIVNSKDQYKKYGNLIRDEGRRLSKMVEQVLDYAGIQSRKNNDNFKKLDLKELIIEVGNKFKNTSNINVEFKNAENIFSIKGDKKALETAISNILDNSLKYCEKKPQIGIEVDNISKIGFCNIKIKDNGFGIPQNEMGELFEPFFRGKVATERTIPGSGLGLSLVKGIIENHGGSINIQSPADEGCIFIISLPVYTEG